MGSEAEAPGTPAGLGAQLPIMCSALHHLPESGGIGSLLESSS